jgi:hypothetical protein
MGIDNNIDWTASATPQGEQYGPGLSRKATPRQRSTGAGRNAAEHTGPRQDKVSSVAVSRHSVMTKLLGDNDLAAFDAGGGDPYNATGRQFRR